MKKLASASAVLLAAVLLALGVSPAAQAYPELHFDLTAEPQVLYGGETFTAMATSDVQCAWTLEWNGDVREHSGMAYTTTYRAPKVGKVTKIPLHGTCAYAVSAGARNSATVATWKRTIMITVLPRSSAVSPPTAGSDLPNTGGPNALFLLGGLALLVSGATAVTVARRRAEAAEIASQRA